jgi:PKD repeat protein
MKKTITPIIIILILSNLVFGQEYNPQALMDISAKEEIKAVERKERVSEFLKTSEYHKKIQLEDGNEAVLVDIIDGHPQYMATHNLQARHTTGVEYIQSADGLNLSLYGSNMTIGVWDGGLVLNSHQEFQNRIKNKLGSEYSNHATHVTGTIAASGVNPEAKGMLPQVTIHSYYAFEDDLGPMAMEAANGLVLSNHSYGLILGWRFNGNNWQWFGQENGQDNRFGSYTSDSRTIDNISYNAPYYTIVWSAGNDRSDVGDGTRPPDGPFNIVGPAASAKNIITVGAITGFENYEGPSSAEISSFSSWGPTNDGRIKPDIVGDGVGLISASSSGDEGYTSLSGTSMSAPNVTGSLGLIQEFFRQDADTFMTSAQLKSLAIHTAREAGAGPGPDYKFGWGVLNAIDAIKVLQGRNDTDTLLTQATLNNGDIHEYELIPGNKTKLTATVVWTDVPGSITELGSSTPHLVNDLDLHLEDEAGNKFYPWRMDLENFGGTAKKGVNSLDNVEKLEFQVPNVRKYKLVVSHKGQLVNNSQTYALTLTYGSANIENDLVYWVNGDGDFQDATNFSNISGGNSEFINSESIKTLTIDENSFDNDGVLSISNDVVLDNIIFTSDNPLNIDLQGNTLTINNAIHSVGENLKISNGKLIVNPDASNNIYLGFDGTDNLTLELDNEGQHIIETNLNVSQLNLLSGDYIIRNKSITLNGLNIFEESNLKLEDNNIIFSGLLFNSSENLNLSRNIWKLENVDITSESPVQSNDTIETFGENSLTGSFHFSKMIANSLTEIFTKLEIDSLYLNDGANILINSEDSLIVHNGIRLNGSNTKQISGTNENQLGNLEFTFRSKLCLENLSISNVHFNSQSVLNIVSGGTITNSVNIFELPCEELLFPDFKISSNCVNSLIYISDDSDGDIENFNWDFGNGIQYDGVNNVGNPIVWFDEVGDYEIILTVSNELQSVEYSRTISITENNLSPVSIIENDQGLVASVPGSNFQWFKDGVPVEGETARILREDNIETGVYNVAFIVGAGDGCQSIVSDSFEYIVTSNEREIDANIKLFPNPVNNILTVKNFENYEKFRIFDFQGKILLENYINSANNNMDVNVSNYKSGLYFIEFIGKNKSIKLKFLIK